MASEMAETSRFWGFFSIFMPNVCGEEPKLLATNGMLVKRPKLKKAVEANNL